MTENKLTGTARVANHSFLRAMYKDNKGDLKYIDPTGKWNYLDLTQVQGVINGGGDTGGGDNPDHPGSGADYYAGSLADGEITERKLLWQGQTSPNQTNNLTLLADVGAKFNMAGDGAMYLVHIQKTTLTAGVKGATTELPLNYDVNNVAREGYFTTTSCYPIYIASVDLAAHQELVIPIAGIGENLGGKNIKSPELHVTFKDDETMEISTVTGYENDGADSGATGANYDVVVETISTFSTQKAVAQLPSAINLFSGFTYGDISLIGQSKFFEDVSDGIQIYFEPYAYSSSTIYSNTLRTLISTLGIPNSLIIPKSKLIAGVNYAFEISPTVSEGGSIYIRSQNGGSWTGSPNVPQVFSKIAGTVVAISASAISIDIEVQTKGAPGYTDAGFPMHVIVNRVAPYRK